MTEKLRGTISESEKRQGTRTVERHDTSGHGLSFLKGVCAGALVGTAAGLLLAPQARAALRGLRRQVTDRAVEYGDAAAERYREAREEMYDAVDDLHEKGRGAYGDVLSAVARGAQDIKNRATETQIELNRGAPRVRRSS